MNSVSEQLLRIDPSLAGWAQGLADLNVSHQDIDIKVLRDTSGAACVYIKHRPPLVQQYAEKFMLAPCLEKLAKNMMLEKMACRPSIQEVANACGLSRSHFTRAFKKTTGSSPHEWLTNARVERAKTLLTVTKLTGCVIATECGFSDQSHFTRVFSKYTGTLPKEWRQQQALQYFAVSTSDTGATRSVSMS